MESYYELVQVEDYIPMNLFIHSINRFKMHIHKEMELILVLEGSINIQVDDHEYVVKENDFILVNSGEAHSTSSTNEQNTCLVLQLDPFYFENYFPILSKIKINCKSFEHGKDEQEKFDIIRRHIAKMAYDKNKKSKGYKFDLGSETLLLIKDLQNNFEHTMREDESQGSEDNIRRLNRIIKYIDNNIENGVTLEDVADTEDISVYHLSRYFKKNLGLTFQDYKNYKRLDKAIRLLSNTENTITSIAFQSGFPSVKSLNSVFRRYFGCTPSKFRDDNVSMRKEDQINLYLDQLGSKTYLDVDRSAAFAKLYTYLAGEHTKEIKTSDLNRIEVHIDMDKKGTELDHYWKNLTTFGRASEGLRENWRNQFRELQREIGFKNVRFHGIFHDDMMICNLDDEGNVVYNWTYVNDLFDFLMEIKVKPFIELGFMPEELKSQDRYIYWWNANVSQPKDMSLWTDLVGAFVKHCVRRYGLKEVESWYFEVWNEPELEFYWSGTKEDYFEFYKHTVFAVKSISNNIRVGGPSITHEVLKYGSWLDDFMNYCIKNNIPLDIITLHIYPEAFGKDESIMDIFNRFMSGEKISEIIKDVKDENLLGLMDRFMKGEDPFELAKDLTSMKRIYYDKEHTVDTLKDLNERVNRIFSVQPEIHVVEWSSTAHSRNLISDTCYTSTFIIKNVVDSIGWTRSLGYWTFTDIIEETKAGIRPFHGGFGLLNNQGLKKPGYYAYYLLSKLGNEIIHKGDDFIVTKDGEDIQILGYNYAYFDDMFIQGDTSALSEGNRYSVFEEKDPIGINLNLSGLEGEYKLTRYQLNRENGSVFDQWQKMGSPVEMTQEEVHYLKGKSQPSIKVENVEIEEAVDITLSIPVLGVELIILQKSR